MPPDHADSNQLLGRQALLERVGRRQRRLPHELRRGPGRLPAPARGDRQAGRHPPRPGARRPHRVAVPATRPPSRPIPGQLVARNEDPSGRNRLPPHDPHLRRHRPVPAGPLHRGRRTQAGRPCRPSSTAPTCRPPTSPPTRSSGWWTGPPPPAEPMTMTDRASPRSARRAARRHRRHRQPRPAAGDPRDGGAAGVGPAPTGWTSRSPTPP